MTLSSIPPGQTTHRDETMQHAHGCAGDRVSVRYGRSIYAEDVTVDEALDTPFEHLSLGTLIVDDRGRIVARLEVFTGPDGRYIGWEFEAR